MSVAFTPKAVGDFDRQEKKMPSHASAKTALPVFEHRSSAMDCKEFKFILSADEKASMLARFESRSIKPKHVGHKDIYLNNPAEDKTFYVFQREKNRWEIKDATSQIKIRCDYTDGRMVKAVRKQRKVSEVAIEPTEDAVSAALKKEGSFGLTDQRVMYKERTSYEFEENGIKFLIAFDKYTTPQTIPEYIEVEVKMDCTAEKASQVICELFSKTFGFKTITVWDCNLSDMLLNPEHDFRKQYALATSKL